MKLSRYVALVVVLGVAIGAAYFFSLQADQAAVDALEQLDRR